MDLSPFIFVALAIAWAVYLIPKALRQHEDSAASRTVDGFSDQMRVLARREPVDARTARLVRADRPAAAAAAAAVGPAQAGLAPTDLAVVSPQEYRIQRAAAVAAARRRLRVVCVILAGIVAVGAAAGLGYVSGLYTLVPVGLLGTWLVACRLMVKRERAVLVAPHRRGATDAAVDLDEDPLTEEIAVVEADLAEENPYQQDAETPAVPGGWDPMPVTLPTYVGKEPAARRTVRTIDLDSTGVWSSGASAADSALAREAEEAERTAKATANDAERRRATGSGA
ncbi:hypothetical protein BH11ACT8_BH11ACT8_22230 [soil metagenome]